MSSSCKRSCELGARGKLGNIRPQIDVGIAPAEIGSAFKVACAAVDRILNDRIAVYAVAVTFCSCRKVIEPSVLLVYHLHIAVVDYSCSRLLKGVVASEEYLIFFLVGIESEFYIGPELLVVHYLVEIIYDEIECIAAHTDGLGGGL